MIANLQSTCVFEYHTFLHHSQTGRTGHRHIRKFEYHTFLHHSQTQEMRHVVRNRFEYHTFLHHSQTITEQKLVIYRLSTIRFYIILKRTVRQLYCRQGLSTIRFYIILKRILCWEVEYIVWVPYVFTSFSNTANNIISILKVWVPYVFTSFSNLKVQKCSASSAPGMVLKRFLANTTFVTINYTVISLFWKVALYIFNQQQCNFAVHA